MATLSLPCAESEAQRVPLLVRARDGGSGGARAASGSLGPSSRRSLSVAATLVTALVVGAVVAVARGDAAGVATSFGGYAFPGAALVVGVAPQVLYLDGEHLAPGALGVKERKVFESPPDVPRRANPRDSLSPVDATSAFASAAAARASRRSGGRRCKR